ncbi:MAG TPA: divalent-cation tolerance protein CutA [Candidatus Methylomirabilis sp.]|nr:divalent-cation tolerance protein CutA [Candidatus Methylomirabilis sp.]
MPKNAHKPTWLSRTGSIVVLVTCPGRKGGETIARTLVQERLAACVNVVPNLTSTYRWEEKIRRDAETLLIIKTRRIRLPALIRRVRDLHPYTIPEIVALPLVGGWAPYLSWLRDSTT